MASKILISVERLYRYYGSVCAAQDISFELAQGEVLGFLGPNGAGKTSTMRMLTGTLAPSAGRVLINGIDLLENPKAAKAQIGYLPENPPVYRELTVDEYLTYCARLRRVAPAHRARAIGTAKQRCGLAEVGRRLIGNLSKGFQQRVGIAQAILHSPPVVILDEPTVGLDPIQIRDIRALIRELGESHGVILSTHILPEVQATCNRVQIIHRGRLVFSESVENLEQRLTGNTLTLETASDLNHDALREIPAITQVERLGERRARLTFSGESPAPAVARFVVEHGWGLSELTRDRRTLEQIFVELTCTETTPHEDAA
jgi:gliding motility-associated transport system ATP-binding protein